MARSKKVPNVKVVDSSEIALTAAPVVEENKTIKKTKTPRAVKAPKKVKFDEKPEAKHEGECHCGCCSVESVPDDDKNIAAYNELYDAVLRAEAQNASHKASMMKILSDMQSYQTAFSNFERNFKIEKKGAREQLVNSLLSRLKTQTTILNNHITALDMFLHAEALIFDDEVISN